MAELRKGPFCGEKPMAYWECGCLTYGEPCSDYKGDVLKAIQCECGADVPTIEAWNTRPIEDRLVGALKDMLNLFDRGLPEDSIGRRRCTVLSSGEFHHIVATYDGSKTNAGINLYINGVLDQDAGTSGPIRDEVKELLKSIEGGE